MEVTRRDFLKLSAGVAAFAVFPNIVSGGNKMADLVIKNVNYLSSSGKVEVGNILIDGDKISKITAENVQAENIIDGRGKFAVPGFINAHTHASMTLLRSYADDLALMDWLNDHIWPIENKMKSSDIRIGAELAAVEMIKGGTTTFMDMYGPNMEEVAKVVERSGLRGVLCRGLIGLFDGDEKLATNIELYKNFNGAANGRIKVMFGPHAIYTCPPDYLKKVYNAAAKLGAEIHIHMNETETEINDCIKNYGKRPFEVVADTGLFELGTLAAHCVHLSDNEIEIIRNKKIRVAHNPGSNMKLASGVCPTTKLLEKNICVALGTDGASSNNNLDMLEEIRLATLLAKVDTLNPLAIPALEALKMATEYGAIAVGIKDIGKLEVGYKADINLFDMSGAEWLPCYNPISLLVYSANISSVDTVIVDGKILMEKRELKTLDEEKIISEFKNCADKLTGLSSR